VLSCLDLSNYYVAHVRKRDGERRNDDSQIEGAIFDNSVGNWSDFVIVGKTKSLPNCNPALFVDRDGVLHLIWISPQGNHWDGSILFHRRSTNYQFKHPGDIEWTPPEMISVKPANEYVEGNPTEYERLVYDGYRYLRTEPIPELGGQTWEDWQVEPCSQVPGRDPQECLEWIPDLQDEVIGPNINISNPMEDEVTETPYWHSFLPGILFIFFF